MLHSDNQTKHFYVIPDSNGYTVQDLEDSNLFRLILNQDNNQKVTSDVIDRKLIKKIKINEVKPTYFRKWVVTAPSGNDIADNTPYHVYFYLENMMGFGMQDRWDRVADYTSGVNTSASAIMTGLAKDLNSKLNAAGPIKNDFIVTILDGTMNPKDATALFGVTPSSSSTTWSSDSESLTKGSGTNSGKKYTLVKHEGSNKVTYVYDDVADDYTVNNNAIIVAENRNSETFASMTELDLRMHTNPYIYNVTMSTGFSKYHAATNNTREYYDEIVPWNDQKQIIATNVVNSTPYISSATKVMAMELYFLRNRADKYDLTKPFDISILNEHQELTANATYYTLDIDYAFSDTQGYTYHSDKQLSIACATKATLATLKTAIMKDSNETAWAVADGAEYTNRTGDTD